MAATGTLPLPPDGMDAADAVAIVGMAARVPGAPDIEAFWRNQLDAVDAVRRTGERRYGVLDDLEGFDADHFRYSDTDAALLDPQQRLFLEVAATALADAGHDPATRPEVVGVYTGVAANRYFLFHLLDRLDRDAWEEAIPGQPPDFVPTRVAHKLGLTGPAVAVQTACSSSLVAVCQAAQALLDFRCDVALAGGAAVIDTEQIGTTAGPCRPFDAASSGIVYGSGAAAVVLKRYADAVRDGDHVDALVTGWAVNNDGADRAGFAAPGLTGQSQVVREALAAAGADPGSLGLIEAHGTGTPIGDAIEYAALRLALDTAPAGGCALGSVKAAIGNLDAAAGVVGLVRAVCAVRDGQIPGQLHFDTPHPEIALDGPLYVATQTRPWPTGHPVRRAGVSSFGLGGTNAHVIVEHPAVPHGPRPQRDLPRFHRRRHWIDRTVGVTR